MAEVPEGRRVSFITDLPAEPAEDDYQEENSMATSPAHSPVPSLPTEKQPRPSLTGQKSSKPVRLTTRLFVDWENKREKAQKAMKARVEPSEPRIPTTAWSGLNFSESMPAVPPKERTGRRMPVQKGASIGPPSPTSTPKGLFTVNQVCCVNYYEYLYCFSMNVCMRITGSK